METTIGDQFLLVIRMRSLLFASVLILLSACAIFALPEISTSVDGEALTIDDAPEMQVIAIAKTVVVKKQAKEVLVWGGDVIVEGRVEGDVAAIGGNVVQKQGAFIGGDVIVFGGQYKSESLEPLRAEGKQTVMFGAFEDELRSLAQEPSQIFTPRLTFSFVVQRILSALFWFIVTFAAATIAPGAVSRATARLKLSGLKITAIGVAGFLLTCLAVIAGLSVLPEYISPVVGLMAFAMVMLAYGFGRVVLHVFIGKLLQERFSNLGGRSETFAILFGVLALTILLSLPYVWTLALFLLFAIGTGLVLTARSSPSWKEI
jgi:hypothetical protein